MKLMAVRILRALVFYALAALPAMLAGCGGGGGGSSASAPTSPVPVAPTAAVSPASQAGVRNFVTAGPESVVSASANYVQIAGVGGYYSGPPPSSGRYVLHLRKSP